jgi:L-threonylcarbamoyladenylate synthase
MKIKTDDIFIYPTDTVWGIGCSLYSEQGHSRIAAVKNTSINKPLSIMFSSASEIYKNFAFPKQMNLSWLEHFFSLETTLGFSLKASRINIPKWATGESEYVSIRCIQSDVIKLIYQELQAPFFTTSLNITGSPPIISSLEARQFQESHAKDALFFNSNKNDDLSGLSSTMVFIDENLNVEIKREGLKINEVKSHLIKLNSKSI